MRLEKLEKRPLDNYELALKTAYLNEKDTLWKTGMTFSLYNQYVKDGRITVTSHDYYYKERGKEGSFCNTAKSVDNPSDVDVSLHIRYSYPVLHNHDYVELVYVVNGECTHFLEDISFSMHTGEYLRLHRTGV